MTTGLMRRTAARRMLGGLVVAVAALALVACTGDEGDETPTVTPTSPVATAPASPTPTFTPDVSRTPAYTPAPAEVCDPIFDALTAVFEGVTPTIDTGDFDLDGETLRGEGCRFTVSGDSSELPIYVEVANEIRAVLAAEGFVDLIQFEAGGPTGTQSVLQRDAELAIVTAGIDLAEGVECPSDQPIASCLEGLEPEQILVHGSVLIASGPK